MENKKCFKCKKDKPLDQFYKHPQMQDGHVNKCKDCNKIDVRKNYKKRNAYYKQYDKNRNRYSIERIIDHRYASMKSRALGKGSHNYSCVGKKICTKQEFKKWCEKNKIRIMFLHSNWVLSNFNEKMAPSVDRIDNTKGYEIENLQWVTKSFNSSKYTK